MHYRQPLPSYLHEQCHGSSWPAEKNIEFVSNRLGNAASGHAAFAPGAVLLQLIVKYRAGKASVQNGVCAMDSENLNSKCCLLWK